MKSIDMSFLDNVPRKPRTVRIGYWVSSFLGDHATSSQTKTQEPPSFSPSSNLIITGKSKETEKTNPVNPNSQPSSSVCRKRPAVQETKRNCRLNTEKVNALSWKGRDTPERLIQLMGDMNGDDPKLVFEKSLTKTDIRADQSRLLMPFNSLISNDFLPPVETTLVEEDINTDDDSAGVGAIMFDERKEKWGIILRDGI